MPARVTSISVAPVKGLALVHPERVELERFGVLENRRFHLVDEEGRLLSGTRLGRLVQIAARYDNRTDELSLSFPEGETIAGAVNPGERIETKLHGGAVPGRVVEGPWADALSAWAGVSLRLVRSDVPGAATDRGPAGAVSLVSEASLEALGRAAGSSDRVDGRRFRMLFGIDGVGAHAEDAWLGRRIRVGAAAIVPRGNVGRCAVTTQNPQTGSPDFDTLRVLARYRGDVDTTERLPFGIWGEVVEPGAVRVGDAVEPLTPR